MILDDGFQHLALSRDVDLVLLDATDAPGLDAMVPAGRLREPLTGLGRAAALVVTRADSKEDVEAVCTRLKAAHLPVADAVEIRFTPESLVAVSASTMQPLEWCRGMKTWLVSGIGNSESFHRSVASLGVEIIGETAFSDHHRYHDDDVRRVRANAQIAGADMVLTTEKDAGKLEPFLTPDDSWWALRIRAEIIRGEERLRGLVMDTGAGRA
jgi:tetraacyldisaccharide 4'-kinase